MLIERDCAFGTFGFEDLIGFFILTELLLSVLCAFSAVAGYSLASYTAENTAFVIYFQAFCVGSLIGLEIPLVTRINEAYQNLRINISSVMEKDYYGALFGGLFFAFLALPYLGMTYTPIVLGSDNFLVAVLYLRRLPPFPDDQLIGFFVLRRPRTRPVCL